MRKKLLPLLLSILTAVSLGACASEPMMPEQQTPEKTWERPTPGEDYYGYVNYEYITTAQIPAGKPGVSVFDSIGEEMKTDLRVIIDEVAAAQSDDPFSGNVRELYLQYLDTGAREQAGYEVLMPVIGLIEAAQDTDELVAALGTSYREYGVSSFFRFEVHPDVYDASRYKLLLFHFNSCGNLKENFTRRDEGSEHIGNLVNSTLQGLKVAPDEAKSRARDVVALINEIMYATMDSSEMQETSGHYIPVTAEEFQKLYYNLDTKELFKAFGFTADELLIFDWQQCDMINRLFTDDHLRALKDYALACLNDAYGQALPPSFADPSGEQTKTAEELDENAKGFVYEWLEEDLGILYGQKFFTKDLEAAGEKMLRDIQNATRTLIQNSTRLSDTSRRRYLKKLDSMVVMLGYDKNYRPLYTVVPQQQGGGLLVNAVGLKRASVQDEIEKLSRPVNRENWKMSPIEPNAVYDPLVNSVTIPAVMFSKASFDPEKGEGYNLGRLGYVIAHEIHHAFDSMGSLFNEIGTYDPEFLPEADRKAFEELKEKTMEYYHQYKLLGVYNIDGEQTLAENLADLGAIQCLSTIPKTKEELQKLYEGAAEQWAAITPVDSVLVQLETDVHSPGEARANAVLSSTDRFYEAYDIKESDNMYVAPENRVRVW